MHNESLEKIDIRGVFKAKNPKMARFIPGIIFSWIERIVHQKDMNNFLNNYGDKLGFDFLEALIKDFNLTVNIQGEENIPTNGRCLFIANHPLGGFDGIVLIHFINKRYGSVKFLVNDILMNIKNIRSVFLPINKHGANTKEGAAMIQEAFESNIPMGTFPAGLCSRKINGKITDLPWKPNFIKKASTFQRDIVPVFVNAKNSSFFYNLSLFRKKIGIKANIEMFFLPDEMYKFRNKEITLIFGKPIPYSTFDKSKTPVQWSEFVREKVYLLNK